MIMNKYIVASLALSLLCGCGSSTTTTAVQTKTAHQVDDETPALGVPAVPVLIELPGKSQASAMPCKDDLDCYTKLGGLCTNGYQGGRMLQAENGRRVGVLYRCISDVEVAEAKAAEEQEKLQERAFQEALKKAAEEAHKSSSKKK